MEIMEPRTTLSQAFAGNVERSDPESVLLSSAHLFRQRRRSFRLVLSNGLRADVDHNESPQIVRWSRGIRTHTNDIAGDLNRSKDEAPRKSPPTQNRRKKRT